VNRLGVPPEVGTLQMCHEPSTSLRLKATSLPSGENAGPHMKGECVASVREPPPVKLCRFSVLRHRELMYAIVPSVAIVGPVSGPAPAVSRTGGPPARGWNQIFVAPPRFEE